MGKTCIICGRTIITGRKYCYEHRNMRKNCIKLNSDEKLIRCLECGREIKVDIDENINRLYCLKCHGKDFEVLAVGSDEDNENDDDDQEDEDDDFEKIKKDHQDYADNYKWNM